jgi:hypothetical protein
LVGPRQTLFLSIDVLLTRSFTLKVSRTDKVAREKEARYAAEQKATVRKTELSNLLENIGRDEMKVRSSFHYFGRLMFTRTSNTFFDLTAKGSDRSSPPKD